MPGSNELILTGQMGLSIDNFISNYLLKDSSELAFPYKNLI